MNPQLNNSNENKDQVFQETETFRPVFFDQTAKRNSQSSSSDSSKRARLDASVVAPKDDPQNSHLSSSSALLVPSPSESVLQALAAAQPALLHHHRHHHHHNLRHNHRHLLLHHHMIGQQPAPTSMDVASSASGSGKSDSDSVEPQNFSQLRRSSNHPVNTAKKSSRAGPMAAPVGNVSAGRAAPKFFRRFRSRSLPIINYASRSHVLLHHIFSTRPAAAGKADTKLPSAAAGPSAPSVDPLSLYSGSPATSTTPSVPPINHHSLKEIDLHEILKNPQLRHDILFDPQLQFRPNLDGERGRRKKAIIEKYWAEIEVECKQFFAFDFKVLSQPLKIYRLPVLFTTLRDVLLSLLPVKDRAPVSEIMDIDLLCQQLARGSFDFVAMARWLGEVFKSHCAPMRDQWVSDMFSKFEQACQENSVQKLVQGLRSIFTILEAMKLDVANHQIRILRPVLIETAVDFEKDYFNQLISLNKIDITDSLKWFYKNHHKKAESMKKLLPEGETSEAELLKLVATSTTIDLLSCRQMATEFPSTLTFDHARLVLLRADVRQLVCVLLCVVLYKQLLANYKGAASYRAVSMSAANITKVQEEVLAIVTDENGNIKWTKNVQAIALQLVKNVVMNPVTGKTVEPDLPQSLIDFGFSWLLKHIQPSSVVYALMEEKIFKDLLNEILANKNSEGNIVSVSQTADTKLTVFKTKNTELELLSIAARISSLMKFHWSVFGNYYTDHLHSNN